MKDQLGREIILEHIPKRIVSLVPSQTELLCYLGLEDSLVGITKFCVHPENLRKEKKIVGGTKKVHLDKIKALQPDIILCNKEENTLEMVMELEKIAPVHVSNVIDLKDVYALILQYGELFDKNSISEKLVEDIQEKHADFRLNPIRKNVVYFIWKNPWMAVGGATFIDAMLKINGWKNIFEDENSRYPEIDITTLTSLKIDLILLSSEPYPFQQKHIEKLKKFTNAEIRLVDGEYFSWYGSRLLQAFDYFKTIE